jgi:hypothetical protein
VWLAVGPGASALVPLREDAVGSFYRPAALHEPGEAIATVPRTATLELGGHAIDSAALIGRIITSLFGEDSVDIFADVRRDDGTLVTVGTRCVEPKLEADMLDRDPLPLDVDGWTFDRGAKVFWDDGEPAGKVIATHVFVEPASVDSDRRCFDHARLNLCLRAEEATHVGL